MTRGSWVRAGAQQTPVIDYLEGIYRYRFQGQVFYENANGAGGALTSADTGVSFHYNLPSNYGDIHTGIYNGEGVNGSNLSGAGAADPNDKKAFQIRGTLRPFATMAPVLRGLRVTGFYDGDNYVQDAEKKRAIFDVTFEHQYINLGADYLTRKDQASSATKTSVTGNGWSVWLTPKYPLKQAGSSIEGLIRTEQFTPNKDASDVVRKHGIYGIAYWFPHTGGPLAAILLDYETVKTENSTTPTSNKIAIHGLLNF